MSSSDATPAPQVAGEEKKVNLKEATSKDYYFDSYSHFGEGLSCQVACRILTFR